MAAPSSMRKSSAGPASVQASTTSRLRYTQTLRWFCLAVALVGLATTTIVAYRRPLAPIPGVPPALGSLRWWDTPLEINAEARMPLIDGDIVALTRTRDGRFVYAAGHPDVLLRCEVETGKWERLPSLPGLRAPAVKTTAAAQMQLQAANAPPKAPSNLAAQYDYGASKVEPPPMRPANLNLGAERDEPAESGWWMVFADPQRGLLRRGGQWHATNDGGSTWHEVELPAEMQRARSFDLEPDGTIVAAVGTKDGANGAGTVLLRWKRGEGGVRRETQLHGAGLSSATLHHGWFRMREGSGRERVWRPGADPAGGFMVGETRMQSILGREHALDVSPAGAVVAIETEAFGENPLLTIVARAGTPGLWTERRFGQASGTDAVPTLALVALSDTDFFLAGVKQGLLRSPDGGANWHLVSRPAHATPAGTHLRLPPPWYFVALLPALSLVGFAWRPPEPPQVPGIADRLASDRPIDAGDPDYLGFDQIALGLSAYLRNRATMPPLTIAITGPWGGGKSSLMNLLKADLARWGHKPVWFNAWHHETEDHLLAALLVAVREQAIPGWFQVGGIGYRARLLWRRSRRQVVAVSIFLLILAASLGWFATHPEEIAQAQAAVAARLAQAEWLRSLFGLSVGDATANAGGSSLAANSAAASVALSVAGLLATLWRGLRGFGVNPAALLASESRQASRSDLQAQTSFRHRFKQEFEDVTHALRPQTMTLFIDDLDRCQPEHAYKVLESVNFLMTSGLCYVVLGLERGRIERGIGLVFKELAELEPAGSSVSTESATQRFARRYLEKLINLEVAVPEATPEQLRALLIDRAEAKRERGPRRGRLAPAMDLTAAWMAFVPVLAAVIFAMIVGLAPSRSDAPAAAALGVGESTQRENALPEALAVPADSRGSNEMLPVAFEPGAIGPPQVWLAMVVGLGIAAVGLWRLSVPAGAVTVDSEDFAESLERICPLLVKVDGVTPRRIKQYINRVRYFAMVRGSYRAAEPGWRRMIGAIVRWISRGRWPEAESIGTLPSENPNPGIDDAKLVLLGAVHEIAPAIVAEDADPAAIYNFVLQYNEGDFADVTGLRDLARRIDADDLVAFHRIRRGLPTRGETAESAGEQPAMA